MEGEFSDDVYQSLMHHNFSRSAFCNASPELDLLVMVMNVNLALLCWLC
jgi:hypothetical protein